MKASRRKYRLLHRLEEELEIPMFLLAVFWLYLFVADLIHGLSPTQNAIILIIWGLFVFEYLLKLYLATDKWRYVKHNWITTVALIIPALRVFRLLNALRFLQSARFITSTRIIRGLTSGKRFFSALNEAKGPAPAPEMHIGLLVSYTKTDNRAELTQLATQATEAIRAELERSTGIQWFFHLENQLYRESEKPVRPAAFLDEATLAIAHGPFDAAVVFTDLLVVSRKKQMEPGLCSPTARVIVVSGGHLSTTERSLPSRPLTDPVVSWNASRLLLQLFGQMMHLPGRHAADSKLMSPFRFTDHPAALPSFNEAERTRLSKLAAELPERELHDGNAMESFVFSLLMAFRHPKEVLSPLLKNKALLLPLALPGLATAAVAPSFILIFTAEIWDVGLNMNNNTVALYALISVIAASFYLVKIQSLFFPRKRKRILTEHLAVSNTVVYLTILLASAGLFLMVGGLMIVIEVFVFPQDLMQTWPTLDMPEITWPDMIRLAAFISTIGVTTGALAGGLESRTLIRHLALFEDPIHNK